MISNERTFISSAIGGVVPTVLAIAGLYLLGPQPLWLPMKGGGEEFNSRYLVWLLALIPCGSLLGCLASIRQQTERVDWVSGIIGWITGCGVGYLVFFQMVVLLGVLHPLLVCGIELFFTLIFYWAMRINARKKPTILKFPLY